MYQEIPKQSRVIERIVGMQENFRQSLRLKQIKERQDINNPSPDQRNAARSKIASAGATRKNKIAFDRFIEIER